MCLAHFQFDLFTYWTMSVTLVLCLMMVLRIPSFSLKDMCFPSSEELRDKIPWTSKNLGQSAEAEEQLMSHYRLQSNVSSREGSRYEG